MAGQIFVLQLERLKRGPLRKIDVVSAAQVLVQGVAYSMGRIDPSREWTWMYLVVAAKPPAESSSRD